MIEIRVARGWSCVRAMRAEARAEVVKISAKKQAADSSIRRQFSLHERSTRLLRHYRDAAGLLRIWLVVRVTARRAKLQIHRRKCILVVEKERDAISWCNLFTPPLLGETQSPSLLLEYERAAPVRAVSRRVSLLDSHVRGFAKAFKSGIKLWHRHTDSRFRGISGFSKNHGISLIIVRWSREIRRDRAGSRNPSAFKGD